MSLPLPPHGDGLVSQPLLEHLIELRRRLLWSLLVLAGAMAVAWVFVQPIYGFLVRPLADAMGTDGGTRRLIYTSLTEGFVTYLKVAFFAGLFAAFPLILTQVWMFIAPALYHRERRVFLPYFVATPLLFYLGGAMVYYIILPLAWAFFLSFQSTGGETVLPIQLEARVGEYLDLIMLLIFAFGLCFQLPVVLMLLSRAGVIDVAMLRRRRKYAILTAFVIAAFLTPPDVLSQTALAIPLIGLYEISILLIARQRGSAPSQVSAGDTDVPL